MVNVLRCLAVLGLLIVVGCGPDVPQVNVPKPDPPTGTKVTLGFNFSEGLSYEQTFYTKQIITQTIQGKDQVTEQSNGITMLFTVDSVKDDGATTISIVHTAVQIASKLPGKVAVHWNSQDGGKAPQLAIGLEALIGRGFKILTNTKGENPKIIGANKMIEAMVAKLAVPLAAKAQLKLQLKSQFGEDAMARNFKQAFAIHPTKPIDNGDSWSRQLKIEKGFPAVVNTTYTLLSREDGIAKAAINGTVTPNTDGPPLEIGPIKMKINLSGTQRGTLSFDEKSGLTLSSEINQDMKGTLTMLSSAGSSSPVPITLKSLIKITSKVVL